MMASFVQSVKQMKGGKALKGGDYQQVGGEFLFEPLEGCVDTPSPLTSPADEREKQLGFGGLDGQVGEEKRVTWCHRMRNTRDHAEIPELREVLGLDGEGLPGKDIKRWRKALRERKGTGFSSAGRRSTSLSMKVPEGVEEGKGSSINSAKPEPESVSAGGGGR